MMKKLLLFCSLPLLLSSCWQQNSSEVTITECNSILAINHYLPRMPQFKKEKSNQVSDLYLSEVNNPILIMFDIDNTIAEPACSPLGSDQWFYAMTKKHEQLGKSHQEAVDSVVPTFRKIQEFINLKPVEEITTCFINELQDCGFTVVALTARTCFLMDRTIEQLNAIGINFNRSAPSAKDIAFCAPQPACYKNGIVFTGPNDKGMVLKTWLEKVKYTPKKIIFVDDKLSNISSVAHAAQELHIPFVGIRYNRLDEKVQSFITENLEQELENIELVPS